MAGQTVDPWTVVKTEPIPPPAKDPWAVVKTEPPPIDQLGEAWDAIKGMASGAATMAGHAAQAATGDVKPIISDLTGLGVSTIGAHLAELRKAWAAATGHVPETGSVSNNWYANALAAAGHGMAAALPMIGPMAAQAGEDLGTGHWGRGAVEATTLLAPPFVEKAIAARAAGAPARAAAKIAGKEADYLRKIKIAFPDTDPAQVKQTIPWMAEEHKAGPIAPTVEEMVAAKDRAIGKIETHVQGLVDLHPNEILQVPVHDIADALDRGLGGPTPGSRPVRGMGTRATDMDKGMKAIESLGLDQPLSMPDLYDRVLRLNAELRKALSESKYDVNAMRQSDPVFRALELADQHARKLIYDRLDQLGMPGIRDLRAQEGALIEVRNAMFAKRLAGDTAVRAPGGSTMGQRIVGRMLKTAGTVGGAVTGGLLGTPGAVAGGAIGTEAGEAASNVVTRGPKPRNVVIEQALRNLEGLQGPTLPPYPGPLPTVNVMPPGAPGGPQAGPGTPPAGPGLPPPPPPAGLPPGAGIGPANWQPGPLPTVTVLPNVPPTLPAPPVARIGLPPRPIGPLDLPPPPYPQLGPAPPPPPPRFGRPTPDQPLPTTWEEVKRFHGGDPDLRGLQQIPSVILDILSLPPEERAAAIAELERSTPPPEPPPAGSRRPPTRGEPPTGTAPPTPPAPAGPAPAPPTSAAKAPGKVLDFEDALDREITAFEQAQGPPASVSPTATEQALQRVDDEIATIYRTRPPGAEARLATLFREQSRLGRIINPQSSPTPAAAAFAEEEARRSPPIPFVPKPSPVVPKPPTTDLVGALRSSLMKTGVSDVPVATWRERFAAASPEALKALAAWLRGPNSSSWTTKVLLPEVNRLLTRDQPALPGAEAVRSQEIATPQFDVPEQGFSLSAPEETQPTQATLGEAPPSDAYLAASEAANAASAKFRQVTEAYRARRIGDAEFLAARQEHEAAKAAFDAAFAREKGWAQPTQPGITEVDPFAHLSLDRLKALRQSYSHTPGPLGTMDRINQAIQRLEGSSPDLVEPVRPADDSLVTDVQASLRPNGTSAQGLVYWKNAFRRATPEAMQSLVTWLRGPEATPWTTKNLLPDATKVLRDLGNRSKMEAPDVEVPGSTRAGVEPGVPPSGAVRRSRPRGRTPAAGGVPNRAPQTGVGAIPKSLNDHFASLLEDARQQGYEGTPDELADDYRAAVAKAQDFLDEQRSIHADAATSGDDLLKEISRAGGLFAGEAGMRGELRQMMESLTRGSKMIRRGAQAGKNRYMPRPVAGVPGAPGIVRMKGGLTLDNMFEHLKQIPKYEHQWENLAEFIEAIDEAINEAVGTSKPAHERVHDLRDVLEGGLGVRPGQKWWTPF